MKPGVLGACLAGPDRQALALALVSSTLTVGGLWAWDLEYESVLFLVPMLGCVLSLVTLYQALEQHMRSALPSWSARWALVLGTLALLAANPPLLFAPAYGWALGLPAAALLLLRIESSWPAGPLVLGLLGAAAYPVLFALSSELGLAALPLGQLLALFGLLLGANELRRRSPAPGQLLFGLVVDVLLLFFPAVYVVAYLASED
jgi:hypothetical protein